MSAKYKRARALAITVEEARRQSLLRILPWLATGLLAALAVTVLRALA